MTNWWSRLPQLSQWHTGVLKPATGDHLSSISWVNPTVSSSFRTCPTLLTSEPQEAFSQIPSAGFCQCWGSVDLLSAQPEILPEQNRSFTVSCLLLAAVRLSLCLVRFVFFYFCCILFIFCIVFLFARVFLSCRVFELSGPPYPSVLSVIFSFQSLQLVLGDSREQIIQHKLKGSPSSSALFASKQTKVAQLTKCFTHKSTTMMTVGSGGEEVAPKARGDNQWGVFSFSFLLLRNNDRDSRKQFMDKSNKVIRATFTSTLKVS